MKKQYQNRILICFLVAMAIHIFLLISFNSRESRLNVITSDIISTQIFLSSKEIQVQKPKVIPPEKPKKKPIIQEKSKKEIKTEKIKKVKPKKIVQETPTIKRKASSQEKVIDDKKMRKYITKIIYLVNRKKKYPRLAQLNREQGLVGIQIKLNRNGELLNYKVEKSSGYERLDQGAIRAILSVSLYPKIYSEYPHDEINLSIPINFQIK